MKRFLFQLILVLLILRASNMFAGENYSRDIMFSGYRWEVKSSEGRVPPHLNYFSSSPENVWVDLKGRLHLKIVKRKGVWMCSEIISHSKFGYGEYIFYLDTDVTELDKNVIFGLFTWDTSPEYSHREIDIEFSRWGGQFDFVNLQYVVQYGIKIIGFNKSVYRYDLNKSISRSIHSFEWMPRYVYFKSQTKNSGIIASWTYRGAIPEPGNEKVRINLYLFKGLPPEDNQEVEIIIKRFRFKRLRY